MGKMKEIIIKLQDNEPLTEEEQKVVEVCGKSDWYAEIIRRD